MKKFNMKKTTTAAVAATVGAVLLLGGAGTLAYWSDTQTSASQTISAGNLDLNTITAGSWSLQQVVTTGTAPNTVTKKTTPVTFDSATMSVAPGDVLTATVQVPVTLAGTNMKATLDVATPVITPAVAGDTTLTNALQVAVVSVDGTNGATKTFAAPKSGNVPVVISVTMPWGTSANENIAAALKSATFSANYTLTQVAAGTVTP
jgi:alternate signal-mediated exported protein